MLTGLHELYEADTPSTSEPPYDCLEGLAGARTTDEFFTSLDENDLMPLFGFHDTRAEDPTLVPCLAFVVDDIGSMSSEINAVKSLIRMLLASEEDEPVRYILVPFNDYGSISSSRFSNINVMYVADRRSSNINVMYVADRRSSNNVCMYMPASRLHVTLLQGWAVAKHLK